MSKIGLPYLKFATFGCWNDRTMSDITPYENVIDKIKEHELDYHFLVVLGDNYYSNRFLNKGDFSSYAHNIRIDEM